MNSKKWNLYKPSRPSPTWGLEWMTTMLLCRPSSQTRLAMNLTRNWESALLSSTRVQSALDVLYQTVDSWYKTETETCQKHNHKFIPINTELVNHYQLLYSCPIKCWTNLHKDIDGSTIDVHFVHGLVQMLPMVHQAWLGVLMMVRMVSGLNIQVVVVVYRCGGGSHKNNGTYLITPHLWLFVFDVHLLRWLMC